MTHTAAPLCVTAYFCHDDCTFRDGVQGSGVTPVPETESGIVARSFLDLRMRLVAQNSFLAGGQGALPSGSAFASRIGIRNLHRHIRLWRPIQSEFKGPPAGKKIKHPDAQALVRERECQDAWVSRSKAAELG